MLLSKLVVFFVSFLYYSFWKKNVTKIWFDIFVETIQQPSRTEDGKLSVKCKIENILGFAFILFLSKLFHSAAVAQK